VNPLPATRAADSRAVTPTPWPPEPGMSPRPLDASRSGEGTGMTASGPYVRPPVTKNPAEDTTTGRATWRGPLGAPEQGTGSGAVPGPAADATAIRAPSYDLAEEGLGEGTIRRLHAVGLDLHIALGLTEVPQATQRLDRAIAELDAAISEIRRTLFGFHLGRPAISRSSIKRCGRRRHGLPVSRHS